VVLYVGSELKHDKHTKNRTQRKDMAVLEKGVSPEVYCANVQNERERGKYGCLEGEIPQEHPSQRVKCKSWGDKGVSYDIGSE
jgi:hypothetical protein